jgi:hypothetical protein
MEGRENRFGIEPDADTRIHSAMVCINCIHCWPFPAIRWKTLDTAHLQAMYRRIGKMLKRLRQISGVVGLIGLITPDKRRAAHLRLGGSW